MKPKLSSIMGLIGLIATSAFAGGSSDGGGNAIPAYHPSSAIIKLFIEESGQTLLTFMNTTETRVADLRSQGFDMGSAYSKIFRDQDNIFDAISNARVEVRLSEPCLDSAGNSKDGSADINSNSICISADRLSKTLDSRLTQVQVFSLLIHEFSHLCGTTEEEARQIQSDMASNLKEVDLHNVGSMIYSAKNSGFQWQTNKIENWFKAPKTLYTWPAGLEYWNDNLHAISKALTEPRRYMGTDGLQLLRNRDVQFFQNADELVTRVSSAIHEYPKDPNPLEHDLGARQALVELKDRIADMGTYLAGLYEFRLKVVTK